MSIIWLVWLWLPALGSALNLAPYFTADMNQHTLMENTPVGTVIYTLRGVDPEGSAVTFGLTGTDKLSVDPVSGQVRVERPIDREARQDFDDNEIRLSVVIEDQVPEGEGRANVVRVPISLIVLDQNDNAPTFRGLPYKASINEDAPVGTTVFQALEAFDADLVGEVLDVKCQPVFRDNGVDEDEADACDHFEVVPRPSETDHDIFRGSVVLRRPLDYNRRQIFRLPLALNDGLFTVRTDLVFSVMDVQNTPPVFVGSMTGVVNEDDPIGTIVMTVHARDGDSGNARRIVYGLENQAATNSYFVIDPNTGDIRIDKALDRESLGAASGGVLSLTVTASELVNGVPGADARSRSSAEVTITIRDVNDEAPSFNAAEYLVTIPENVPFGTPLANLNMEVKDTDTGPNALFKIDLIDGTGKFAVEPTRASGHTAVSLKLNSKQLDYENPNERKFLVLVVASETNTSQKLSSTATVTVQVQDLNDNVPAFDRASYSAIVDEDAAPGTEVITITAKDRDGGDFGNAGVRYALTGPGSELFSVDPVSGTISVAACEQHCLDYEATKAYFLSLSATDNLGQGKRSLVSVRITVNDVNDNAPVFDKDQYEAGIDEGQTHFEPPLVVRARDADESSVLRYAIIDGNVNDLFQVDRVTGELRVRAQAGLQLVDVASTNFRLLVEASDGGPHRATTAVNIEVRDINDHSPEFSRPEYQAVVAETSPVGMPVEQVQAIDADLGVNAELTYRIQKGAYDDFVLDPVSGKLSLLRQMDYDRRSRYAIEVVAVDKGDPAMSGTATVVVQVLNKNDKSPRFLPTTQRAQITEDSPVGTEVMRLNATDPDATAGLVFAIVEPLTAVDRDGKPVEATDDRFKGFFSVHPETGLVSVADTLDRSVAASVTMTIRITDSSASPPQHGFGHLIVTILDINDFPPSFPEPWSEASPYITLTVPEEQPNGTIVHRFVALDPDSNIAYFEIRPKNPFFRIEPGSGQLIVDSRIDYESLEQKRLTFDLTVFDAGVPQKSATAIVIANIENVNDEAPEFDQPGGYNISMEENAPLNSLVVTVKAVDKDDGEFGHVTYSLTGSYRNAFSIGAEDGMVRVLDPRVLDRELTDSNSLQVVASDSVSSPSSSSSAPSSLSATATARRLSVSVPVHIHIVDQNDNAPIFVQPEYRAVIVDNIPFSPDPPPIVQVSAVDPDVGLNGELFYWIASGNEDGQFMVDNRSGVVYPNATFRDKKGKQYELVILVLDEAGQTQRWPEPSSCRVLISVENVNSHKPEWFPEPVPNETVEVVEEESVSNAVILKVNARDRDLGADNSRVSYYFKVANENVGETAEFSIDSETGEVRAKVSFDREARDKYELVLVARDHGLPIAFEALRFITVSVVDVNDHEPAFDDELLRTHVRFTVPEEEPPGYLVGRVEAHDLDDGRFGRVFYYIVAGNQGKWFSIDKTYGNIYTKQVLDREKQDHYAIRVKTTNNPDHVCDGDTCDIPQDAEQDRSVITVHILVEDKNDNLPAFESTEYFVGMPYHAKVGDLILDARARDPDLQQGMHLSYSIRSSNLYRSGSTQSAGSLVPSPFVMEKGGRLVLGALVAEFNQDSFIIEIETREAESGHRAHATVYLWIYEPHQLIRMTLGRPPMDVNKRKERILSELRNVTQKIVVLDDIRYHVDADQGLTRDKTDLFVHAVDPHTNTILQPAEVLPLVDAHHDYLAPYYEQVTLESIEAASAPSAQRPGAPMDPNLAALIALLLVLFLGIVMFCMVCCCIRNWVFAKAVAHKWNKPQKLRESLSRPDDLIIYHTPTSVVDEPGGATDNPLWMDQKYKAYEEQELTMTVFGDQDNSVISGSNGGGGGGHAHSTPQPLLVGGGGSRHGSLSRAVAGIDTQSNAYATINKLPASMGRRSLFNGSLGFVERDYATLDKMPRSPPGPIVPGIHSAPFHQNSLPRRYSNDHGPSRVLSPARSSITINQNGEPELVADLL